MVVPHRTDVQRLSPMPEKNYWKQEFGVFAFFTAQEVHLGEIGKSFS